MAIPQDDPSNYDPQPHHRLDSRRHSGLDEPETYKRILQFKGLLNCLITFLFLNGFERMRAFWKSEVMYDNRMSLDFLFKFSKTKWPTIK